MLSQDEILQRNRLLRKFFTDRECPVEILEMNINAPVIVWNGTHVLSAYVKNFKLIFTDAPVGGKTLKEIRLNTDRTDLNKNALHRVLLQATHRKVFRIKLKGQDLYLSGYNFTDKANKEGRYPVFSKLGAKYYFTKETAQKIIDENPDYNLEIV